MFIFGCVIQCLQVWGLCAGPLHRRKAPCGCSSSSRQSAGRHSGTNRRNTGRYVFSFRCGHHLIPWPQENDHVLCVTGNIPKRKIQKCVKGSLRIESYCLTACLIHFSTSCFFFSLLFASVRRYQHWHQIESSDTYLGGAEERGECISEMRYCMYPSQNACT